MKKLLVFILCFSVCFSGLPQSKSGFNTNPNTSVDGYFKFSSTKLPLPLGRYVQLSSTSVPFKFSKPNSNGDGEWSVNFSFEILRHVPNMEYVDFRMRPIGNKELDKFYKFKFKKDQKAVEKLTTAIANEHLNRVMVKYTSAYYDLVPQEITRIKQEWNGTEMYIDTDISIAIPLSQMSITGPNPNGIKIKGAYIMLTNPSRVEGPKINLIINISTLSQVLLQYNRITANITTKSGNFSILLEKRDAIFSYQIYFDEERYISPRDIDKLLTYPISIELELE